MKRILCATMACAFAWMLGAPVSATADPIINFVPGSQSGPTGSVFTVDIVISNPTGPVPDVGGFAVVVLFNGTILSVDDIIFGGLVGNGINSIRSEVLSAGTADVAEQSLTAPISTLQDGSSFTLFSIEFEGIAEGTSSLGFDTTLFNDAGVPFPVASGQAASIEVADNPPPTGVPEPSTALMLILGLGLVAIGAHRHHPDRG